MKFSLQSRHSPILQEGEADGLQPCSPAARLSQSVSQTVPPNTFPDVSTPELPRGLSPV